MPSSKSERVYLVEEVLEVFLQKGKKMVRVKWKFYPNPTSQEFDKFRQENPNMLADLERLDADWEARQQGIDPELSAKVQLSKLLLEAYGGLGDHPPVPTQQHKAPQSVYEAVRSKHQARREFLRLNRLGLRDFGVNDYRYFSRLRARIQPAVNQQLRMKLLPKSECMVSEVAGVVRHEQSYRYLVVVAGRTFTCSEQQALQRFPCHFLQFVVDFTNYLTVHLAKEIECGQFKQKSDHFKRQTVTNIEKITATRQKFEQLEDITFGLDQEDIKQRRKRQEAVKKQELSHSRSRELSVMNNDKETIPLIKQLCEEMLEDIGEIRKRRTTRQSNSSEKEMRRASERLKRGQSQDEQLSQLEITPRKKRKQSSGSIESSKKPASDGSAKKSKASKTPKKKAGKNTPSKKSKKREIQHDDDVYHEPESMQSGSDSNQNLRRSARLRNQNSF